MSYLVYCPTCQGKMSVNANTCPHCGETDFFEYTPHMDSRPCDYNPDDYALGCYGTGFLYREQVHCNIYNWGEGSHSGVRIGNVLIEATKGTALWAKLEETVPYHNYYIKNLGDGFRELYLYKTKCPKCNGTGTVMKNSGWGTYDKDRRKRV